MRSLVVRSQESELMDDPELDPAVHQHALRGLRRLNMASRSAEIVWRPILATARRLGRPVSVLDVATGSGDVPIAVAKRAAQVGIGCELVACDKSVIALEYARRSATEAGVNVSFFQADARTLDGHETYDVVMSSLFLHHLTDGQSEELLRRMGRLARHLVLISDLRRCRRGLILAHAAARLLTRSYVVHVDGPRSVRAAYTMREVQVIAKRAGLTTARVERRWPCRFLLTWEKA